MGSRLKGSINVFGWCLMLGWWSIETFPQNQESEA